MQKRTTNYSFQKFGDVFYSVNHNAGHLIDYVENDLKSQIKRLIHFIILAIQYIWIRVVELSC